MILTSKNSHKPVGLLEGIIIAFAISLLSAMVFTFMSAFFPTRWLLHALIMGVSFVYVIYLLVRSQEKAGKLSVVVFWMIASIATWLFSPSLLISLIIHATLIWLVRALYYYSSLFMAMLDLLLLSITVIISVWVLFHTKSVFLAVWSFLLLQSLFVLIPGNIQSLPCSSKNTTARSVADNDRFETAYQSAQLAIRQFKS